jgi:hypothetical protein
VEPNAKVSAADALETAQKLAEEEPPPVARAARLCIRRVGSSSLFFSASLTFLGLRPLGMLAGEAGLKLFDLFFDFLFAVVGGKEDIVWVSALLFLFAATAVPVG